MILAGALQRCTFIADFIPGAPCRRTEPSRNASIALGGSSGNRITKYLFCKGRSLFSQISELRPLVQGITPRPWKCDLTHWGG